MARKDKRTESLTEDEIFKLKEISLNNFRNFTEFSVAVKVQRTALINTIARGSGSPLTVRRIRKFLSNFKLIKKNNSFLKIKTKP